MESSGEDALNLLRKWEYGVTEVNFKFRSSDGTEFWGDALVEHVSSSEICLSVVAAAAAASLVFKLSQEPEFEISETAGRVEVLARSPSGNVLFVSTKRVP